MLPVRLRHAADHLAEHEHPVHLVFLDRLPRGIALVVRYNQQLVLHLLQTFNVSSVIVQKGVYSITVKLPHTDIDEQEISRLNRARHAIAPDVDDPDVLSLTPIEHVASFCRCIFNGVENLHELLIHNARAGTDGQIQNVDPEHIMIMCEGFLSSSPSALMAPVPEESHSGLTLKALAISSNFVV